MRRFVVCSVLLFSVILSIHRVLAAQAASSPVGTWEMTIHRATRGIAMVTFSNDFTVTGYAIATKAFSLFTITGNWGIDDQGNVVASYVEQVDGNNVAGHFTASLHGQKLNAHGPTTGGGALNFSAVPATDYPDISGNWVGELKRGTHSAFESYTVTSSTNLPAVFDVTGQGTGPNGVYPITGAIMVTARNFAQGFTVGDPEGTGIVTNSFYGRFLRRLD